MHKAYHTLTALLRRIPADVWAGVMAVLVVAAANAQLLREVYSVPMLSLHGPVPALAEGMVLTLPYWFLRGRWRRAVLVPVWGVPLFVVANLMYFRALGSVIPLSSYFFTDNFSSLLFRSAAALLRWKDAALLLLPATVTAWYARHDRRIAECMPIGRRGRLCAVVLTAALYVAGQCYYLGRVRDEWRSYGMERSLQGLLQYKYVTDLPPKMSMQHNGLTTYVVKHALIELLRDGSKVRYSVDDRAAMLDIVDENRRRSGAPLHDFSANRGKNLIIVVVESLNASVLSDSVGGEPVAPVLAALMEAPGSISARHVVSQVSEGVSSDGLILYNSGLLPLRDRAAAMMYPDVTYPGLAAMLGYDSSAEAIAEPRSMWRHASLSRAMGYEALYDRADLESSGYDIATVGDDEAVLSYAAGLTEGMQEPFVLMVTTLSTHMPFNFAGTEGALPDSLLSGLPRAKARYYSAVRYFDGCLGRFLDRLKRSGVYDRSVIVVASDHNVAVSNEQFDGGYDAAPGEILFVAANTGVTMSVDKPVGQVDVYPTLLDIMSAPSGPWRGLGLSMVREGRRGAVDRHGRVHGRPDAATADYLRRAWDASSLIIRGDAFGEGVLQK